MLLIVSLMTISMTLSAQVDSLVNMLNGVQNPEKKVDLMNEIAEFYLYSNLDSALKYSQKGIITSRNIGYRKGEILALFHKSEVFLGLGEYDKAKIYIDRLTSLAEDFSDKKFLGRAYMLKGLYFFYMHKFNLALEQYEQSFSLFRQCNDLTGMGDVQNKMAQPFFVWEEYEMMYEYYLGALECYQKAGDRQGIAITLNNIGLYFYVTESDFQKAESYIKKAIKINLRNGSISLLSKNYMLLSNIKKHEGQIDSSFYFTDLALNLARKLGNPLWESSTLIDLGMLYQSYGSDSTALKYFYQALNLSKNTNSFINLRIISNHINQIYYKQGNMDSAYLYQFEQFKYNDSIFQNNSEVKFTELKFQLETEMTRQKTILQNQKRFYIYLMIFLSLSLVIIILMLLYTRQKIKIRNALLAKEVLANKIELKNKELTNNILISQKKSESIGTIIRTIEDDIDVFPEESRQLIDRVVKKLRNVEEEKGWEDFELSFSQVHESFFEKLDQLYPDLSLKERRLCALLRLNMSSKEIAEVTQMTAHSVDTARYRLRKKLGIADSATDLINFLKKT